MFLQNRVFVIINLFLYRFLVFFFPAGISSKATAAASTRQAGRFPNISASAFVAKIANKSLFEILISIIQREKPPAGGR